MSERQDALTKFSDRMRKEWDRRIQHDYRYWMSDGVDSDSDMWQVGERDFEFIVQGLDLSDAKDQVILELGCGVGRLLRPAAKCFGTAIGIDVSGEAIETAQKLLSDVDNVKLFVGNGTDLSCVDSQSVDLAHSFATIGSIPVSVTANYLLELSRVLKKGGRLRLQVYLGNEQVACEEDTISIRSYDRECFVRAVGQAGFAVEGIHELILPFEVSDRENGVIANLVFLEKKFSPVRDAARLAQTLLPSGEKSVGNDWSGSKTEYLMALARAKQHMDAGQAEEAKDALEYATEHYENPDEDTLEILEDLRKALAKKQDSFEAPKQKGASVDVAQKVESATRAEELPYKLGQHVSSECYERNLKVIQDRFPELLTLLEHTTISEQVSVKSSEAGSPVVYLRGMPLANPQKPERGAAVWVERLLNNPQHRDTKSFVVGGFACGYHIEALAESSNKEQYVIEPNAEVLKASLAVRDCTKALVAATSLTTSIDELKKTLRASVEEATCSVVIHPQTQAADARIMDEVRRVFFSAKVFEELSPSIGVVSPIYGGSLPIAAYTANALGALNQRFLHFDLGCFHGAFRKMGEFLKSEDRISVLEGQYVEMMSELVLQSLSERPVDILICLAQAPMSPKVLTELRERGVIVVMWFVEDCRRFRTWELIAPYYDYMFIIQQEEFPAKVEAAGAGKAIYLPVGCDPSVHNPLDLSEEDMERYGSDISFVGAGYNNRRHMLSHLNDRDFKIWGTEWPDCLPFTKLVQDKARRISPEEYVKIFNATKVNLNLHSSMERDGVEPFGDFLNPRTFELAATGAFQLVDERVPLAENFEPGKEVEVFNNQQELEDQIDYYLAHPEERQVISQAARARALRDHTYEQRVRAMLEYIYADKYEELKSKINHSPWPKTLQLAEPYPELHKRLQAAFEKGEEPTLNALVNDIQTGKGNLTETEQKLLFLHHIRKQISYVRKLREGDS